MRNTIDRTAAGIIAALAWLSLLRTYYDYSYGLDALYYGVVMTSLFYTHWATLIVAMVFSGIALGIRRWATPDVMGHVVIIMGILTCHYWYFQGWHNFLASPHRSKVVHGLLPALIVLYWIFFIERRHLRAAHPLYWTAFPLLYTAYALARGALTGQYAYEVGDPAKLGYVRVLGLILLTIILSIVAGYGVFGLNRVLTRRAGTPPQAGEPFFDDSLPQPTTAQNATP